MTPAPEPEPLPRIVYELAEAVVLFRYRVERAYVSGGYDPLDDATPIPDPQIPESVDECLTALVCAIGTVTARAGGRSGLEGVQALLRAAAEDVRASLQAGWLDAAHREKIDRRRGIESDGFGDAAYTEMMLADSLVGPGRWLGYQTAVGLYECGLPADLQPVFRLGLLLTAFAYPTVEGYMAAGASPDGDVWHGMARQISPLVESALAWAAAAVPQLETLVVRAGAKSPVDRLFRLHERVSLMLEGRRGVRATSPESPLLPAEVYGRLVKAKNDIDLENRFVFRHI